MEHNKDKVAKANLFHVGNTCPYCQEMIAEGQNIITCEKCSSIQHETCWEHNNGCASYSCDKKVRVEHAPDHADIVISSAELDKVIVPPTPVRRSGMEAAKAYLPEKPERMSRMAIASAVIAAVSVLGIAGIFSKQSALAIFIIALFMIVLAILTGIIALVKINMNKKLSGNIPAILSVVFSSALMIMYIAFLHQYSVRNMFEHTINLKLSEIPDESQLSKLDPAKANALRANTVVQCLKGGSIFSDISLGSGVITKIKDKKAYIITNKHVIGMLGKKSVPSGKDIKIKVTMFNKEESDAKIDWLAPPGVDIAIISCPVLTKAKYTPIYLMDTSLPPSSKSFAVGNPMNLFWSYTEGFISSIRKKAIGNSDFLEIYQTQTPINQGNSGGGLYSMDGKLIGINTWLHSKSMSEGLNFAISTVSILKLLGDNAKTYLSLEKPDKTEKH